MIDNHSGSTQLENLKYTKTDELISKSVHRTIFRGFDNDSGCEVAWGVYPLKLKSEDTVKQMIKVLDNVMNVRHQYILNVNYYYFQNADNHDVVCDQWSLNSNH